MQALVFTGAHRVEVQARPTPTLKPGHCLIQTAYVGLCGADAAFFKGTSYYLEVGLKTFPFVFGHEWCGTIVAMAEDVTGFQVGERVAGHNFVVCGTCKMCRVGRPTLCLNHEEIGIRGSRYDGAAAQYFLVPANVLARVPAELSGVEAAIVEPITSVVHAIERTRVSESDRVAVLGTGNLGLAAVQLSKALGATVHAFGIEADSLELARQFGADVATSPEDAIADGYDVVLEISGAKAAARRIPHMIAPGGRAAFVGIVPGDVDAFAVTPLVIKNVDVHGVLSGLQHWDRTLALAARKWIDLRAMIDRVFPYQQVQAACERLLVPGRSKPKVILDFGTDSATNL